MRGTAGLGWGAGDWQQLATNTCAPPRSGQGEGQQQQTGASPVCVVLCVEAAADCVSLHWMTQTGRAGLSPAA